MVFVTIWSYQSYQLEKEQVSVKFHTFLMSSVFSAAVGTIDNLFNLSLMTHRLPEKLNRYGLLKGVQLPSLVLLVYSD